MLDDTGAGNEVDEAEGWAQESVTIGMATNSDHQLRPPLHESDGALSTAEHTARFSANLYRWTRSPTDLLAFAAPLFRTSSSRYIPFLRSMGSPP
ncbi:hypothetical protein PM082_022170 [Marasmius tenuissimus]|nr:hypothetical protein PM082_022170 [Marasmius tenuissimus]